MFDDATLYACLLGTDWNTAKHEMVHRIDDPRITKNYESGELVTLNNCEILKETRKPS